jgi:DNA-binding MarR family transcriptional regulator
LLSNTPDIYRPAVAHAVFPPLGAHLTKTYFPYINNKRHEATFMNVLIAPTAAGKSCIDDPVNYIMADIRRRDEENLRLEKEWKEETVSKGANKEKRKRPEGLVIQEIDADTTNAAFVRRLKDADGRFLYTKMNEIEQFDALKTSAKSTTQFQIMCLAFDPGNVYGQVRVGLNSVCERVCIRYNWNACTTVRKGRNYFRSVVTDGPLSRINFCTIPEMPIGSPMPVYGTYNESFAEKLRPYIDNLTAARGVVECRQARQLAKKLVEENADFARLSQSRVFENLSFRATVIAYLKACTLYVANGMKWDRTIETFVRWSLHYDLWCKMKFFGQMIEDAETVGVPEKRRPGPQNLLDFLSDTFTYEDAGEMRRSRKITTGSISVMLNNWKNRGFIKEVESEVPVRRNRRLFCKTEEYLTLKMQGL